MKLIHQCLSMRTSVFLVTSIFGVLSFTGCERKPATVEMILPSNPPNAINPTGTGGIENYNTARLDFVIDRFERAPTVENQAAVKIAFVKMDVKIAEQNDKMVHSIGVERSEATAQFNELQRVRALEMTRFTKDQDGLALDANLSPDSRSTLQKGDDPDAGIGEKVEDGAKKVGRTLGKVVRKTGEAIDGAAQ